MNKIVSTSDHTQGAQAAALFAPPERYSSVRLSFNPNTNLLFAEVFPCESEEECIDLIELEEFVAQAGYEDLKFEDGAFDDLALRVRRHEHGEYRLGQRVDAVVSLFLSADKLEATLTLEKAHGGAPANAAQLQEALANAGVPKDRYLTEVIEQALEIGEAKNLVVARGVAPIDGVNSRLEILLDLSIESKGPKADASGLVNHYDVHDFIIVDIGTPLARRHPASRGIDGCNVCGQPIPAVDGKNTPFPSDQLGVAVSPDDPDLLISSTRGHPVQVPGGMRVDNILVLDAVDLRTGNVEFDGSILVKGDVSAGVSIQATGDVIVQGTVENATIKSGNDMVISGGVIGPDLGREVERETNLQAGGSIEALFISAALIRAGDDIRLKEYLYHSDTWTLGAILLGQQGGHGLLAGGHAHGCRGIAVNKLGTSADVTTHASAGRDRKFNVLQSDEAKTESDLADQLNRLERELSRLEDPDAQAAKPPAQYLEKLRNTVDHFRERREMHENLMERIDKTLLTVDAAAIAVRSAVYTNVQVAIHDIETGVTRETKGGRFTVVGQEITWV